MSADRLAVEPDVPYPGPIPFTDRFEGYFHGRAQELDALRSLLRTERIVVLHSASGAGKTSLIQAGLLPRMRREGFQPLPPVRVHLPPPAQVAGGARGNRFTYSVIKSIEDELCAAEGGAKQADDTLVGIRLANYFAHRSALRAPGEHTLLVFDQFEELFTVAPRAHRERVEFFNELAAVLRDKSVWALFAMRDEYVANLDRYKRLVPAQLSARFHLDFLSVRAARRAIEQPASKKGVPFTPQARDSLLWDLVGEGADQRPSSTDDRGAMGERQLPEDAVVDPLHLQLVCTEVWRTVGPAATAVTLEHVEAIRQPQRGGQGEMTAVDVALMRFCDDRLAALAKESEGTERRVREWLEDELVTAGRFRRQAIAADPESESELARGQAFLDHEHILRPTVRIGATWYEIAHDRLVEPILLSNERWFAKNLTEFESNARAWCAHNRPGKFPSLPEAVLREAEAAAKARGGASECEAGYLEFCRQQNRIRRDRQRAQRVGVVASALGGVLVVISLVGGVTWYSTVGLLRDDIQELEAEKQRLLTESETQRREKEALASKFATLETRNKAAKQETALVRRGQELAARHAKVRELHSAAMRHRWQLHNHDVALLLASMAVERNDAIESQGDRLPWLQFEGALWAITEALPFVRRVPASTLGGAPGALFAHPDGARVVLVGDGARADDAVLDLDRGQLRRARRCHAGVHAYSPSGRRLAAVQANALVIRDGQDCRPLHRKTLPPGSEADARQPRWSRDGKWLMSFLADGGAVVHSATDDVAEPLVVVPPDAGGDGGSPALTAFAVDGERFAFGDEAGGIRLAVLGADGRLGGFARVAGWEEGWPDGDALSRPRHARLLRLAFVRVEDADWIAGVHAGGAPTRGGRIFLHPLPDGADKPMPLLADERSRMRESVERELGRQGERRQGEAFVAAAFSPDGRWLVTAGELGSVIRWDLRQPARELGVPMDPVAEERSREDTTASWVDRGSPVEQAFAVPRLFLRGLRAAAVDVLVSDDGLEVYAREASRGVRIWRMQRAGHAYTRRAWSDQGYIYTLDFDPALGLVTSDNRGALQVWEVQHRPLVVTERDGMASGFGTSIRTLDAHGGMVALGLRDRQVHVVDLAGGGASLRLADEGLAHRDGLWSVALRPQANDFAARYDVVSGDHDGRLIFWDLAPAPLRMGDAAASLELRARVGALAFHPEGRWLVAGTSAGMVAVVDLEGEFCVDSEGAGREATAPLPCVAWQDDAGRAAIRGVAFDRTGGRLAYGGDAGLLEWRRFTAHADRVEVTLPESLKQMVPGTVTAVAWLPRRPGALIAAGTDGNLTVWDTASLSQEVVTLHGEGSDLQSLAVAEEGGLVAAGDARGRFMVWNLNARSYVCALALRDLTREEWHALMGEEPYKQQCSSSGHPSPGETAPGEDRKRLKHTVGIAG